jgi:hypothetical protein
LACSQAGLRARILGVGDGVADSDVVQVLDGADEETHLASPDAVHLLGAGHQLAQVGDLVFLFVAHKPHALALAQLAVNDADVNDDTAVVVINAVEDQGAQRLVRLAFRRRELVAQLGDELIDALPGLGADEDRVLGAEPQHLLDFLGHAHRVGSGQDRSC